MITQLEPYWQVLNKFSTGLALGIEQDTLHHAWCMLKEVQRWQQARFAVEPNILGPISSSIIRLHPFDKVDVDGNYVNVCVDVSMVPPKEGCRWILIYTGLYDTILGEMKPVSLRIASSLPTQGFRLTTIITSVHQHRSRRCEMWLRSSPKWWVTTMVN